MAKNKIINVEGSEIAIITSKENDYISLTDMAKSQMQEVIIIKWHCIIRILIIPNSVQLKMLRGVIILFCQLKIG